MKKRLLIGTALLAAVSVFPQNARINVKPSGKADYSLVKANLYSIGVNEPTAASPLFGSGQSGSTNQGKPASPSISWSLLCGSMNTYGMLVSSSRPLQYNPALNTVSFIHRKSTSYQPIPALPSTAESGVIVAEISSNWGTSWDSTCIWSNATNWGRYPEGAIYNPTGNTSISNAYVVGSGPVVSGSNFVGNWYASKKLGTYDKTASSATGAQQFLSFTLGTYPPNQNPHGWMRNGFSSTDDGIVRTVGVVADDLAGLATTRGFAVATGTFNGTAFDWRIDTLIPPVMLKPDGSKYLSPDPQMAWNQAGTVGYVVGTGVRTGAIRSNRSSQPIIYKMDRSTNPAATWTLLTNQIDFNAPTATIVPYYCAGQPVTQPVVNGDTIGLPFTTELDIAVDKDNKLHVGAVFMSGATDHPDSLNYYSQYVTSINPSEQYKWPHVRNGHPYIWDIIGDGTAAWKVVRVDSISSEGPDAGSGRPGYTENPWDPTGTNSAKINMDARLQLGRTPDGKYITFSWVESDSSYTFNAFKWNNLPDIKTRVMAINSGTSTYVMDVSSFSTPTLQVSPKQNLTTGDNNVMTRATLHYMSPITSAATVYTSTTAFYTVEINTPLTVTNSNPYSQLTNNATWYGATKIAYKFKQASTVGISKNSADAFEGSYIYPNPAQSSAVLALDLTSSSAVDVTVFNTVGQAVKSIRTQGQVGENHINIDLSGLSTGIYLVNVKAGNASTTKKLIVE
ncbi:MAG: T9SS type A sorting domain-containing protein [bacterium]|nr:T9SS type A sorting domain-containing protein [bacterium]